MWVKRMKIQLRLHGKFLNFSGQFTPARGGQLIPAKGGQFRPAGMVNLLRL